MACAEAKNNEDAEEGDGDLGPTLADADAEAELMAHFGTLDIVLDAAQTSLQTTASETAAENKQRYSDEKKVRKQNKQLGHSDMLVACFQNFNGSSSREKIEEAVRVMSDQNIGIVFGQEGRRPVNSVERFDTGHLFIAFGGLGSRSASNMRKDGNFFTLNEKWKNAFARGGKERKRFCPRLVTLRIPLQNNKALYLVNVHSPDSSKSAATKRAFQLRLEMALREKRATDVMIVMGDFNASTGTSSGATDLVCGPHGNPHQDDPGRKLKATAAMLELVDLTTWEEQRMVNTHYDTSSRSGRQIDRAFVTLQDRHMVVRCVNAAMIVDSDHECVRLQMIIEKTEQQLKTKRKGRQQKEAGGTFGREADPRMRAEAVAKVRDQYEKAAEMSSTPHSKFNALMGTVTRTLDDVQDKEQRKESEGVVRCE
jgi:exonuclease III